MGDVIPSLNLTMRHAQLCYHLNTNPVQSNRLQSHEVTQILWSVAVGCEGCHRFLHCQKGTTLAAVSQHYSLNFLIDKNENNHSGDTRNGLAAYRSRRLYCGSTESSRVITGSLFCFRLV